MPDIALERAGRRSCSGHRQNGVDSTGMIADEAAVPMGHRVIRPRGPIRRLRVLRRLEPREFDGDLKSLRRVLFAKLGDEPAYFLVHQTKCEYIGPLRRGEVVPAARVHYPDDPDVHIISNTELDSDADD